MDPTTNRINTIAKGIPVASFYCDVRVFIVTAESSRTCAGFSQLRHRLFERLAVFGCAFVFSRDGASRHLPGAVPLFFPPFPVFRGRRKLRFCRRTDTPEDSGFSSRFPLCDCISTCEASGAKC